MQGVRLLQQPVGRAMKPTLNADGNVLGHVLGVSYVHKSF
jgi:hypothetical protein